MTRAPGNAEAWVKGHRTFPIGYCLKFVRSALGVAAMYPSAAEAWDHARWRHHGDDHPPAEVPVFWHGGQFGHVALSAGGGKVWSTDILVRGRADLVDIGVIAAHWHYTYLGWSADLNGVRVYTPPKPLTLFLHMKHGPEHERWTRVAQRHLGLPVTGVFDKAMRRKVIAYRKANKLGRPFGWVGPKVWRKMGEIK